MKKQMRIPAVVGALLLANPAIAAPQPPEPAPTEAATAAISDKELDDLRGGEALILTNQTLTAITSGNVINGNYTAGAVSLSDNALANFNGIGNLLINTGAQVNLQAGMNLTINVGE